MNLALITPTRNRWYWLTEQAKRIAAQLGQDDCWVIVIDQDNVPPKVVEQLNELVGVERLYWALLCYARQNPPVARISYAHNVGVAMAPPGHAIVEVDDHDLLEPGALDAVREALDRGVDYVFGCYHQQAIIDGPGGRTFVEPWPDVQREYPVDGFARDALGTDGIALRAIRRTLWDRLGGWKLDVWPCADKDFAVRAERLGASIECLPQFLCTVTVEPDSLSANYRGVNPLTGETVA